MEDQKQLSIGRRLAAKIKKVEATNDANNAIQFNVFSTKYDEDTQIYSITLSQSLEINQNYSISIFNFC